VPTLQDDLVMGRYAALLTAAALDPSVRRNGSNEQNNRHAGSVLVFAGNLEQSTASHESVHPLPVPVRATAVNLRQKAVQYGTGGIAAELNTALGWPGLAALIAQVAL